MSSKNNPPEPCQYCGHPFSLHFSDDVRGMGSKDARNVHQGCSYQSSNDGSICQCPGFRPARNANPFSSRG
ncbi:hypothetical protein [Nitrososphaera viennensis]|uniref:Uncharacterized protein n=2 Tax=Nitrososphaera viennensis TaxID=1034015 RepID=A0A060HQC7_9ARCH|nr:hypothetical protein [Nitrososphaera viennensis]AIC15377.1 hypothetical protein NVIE_1166 [Nitrososphaera viennensis EN76]UVS70275.1 hypothetical protein NWT39_05670 [Nitrososphaera viennensis]